MTQNIQVEREGVLTRHGQERKVPRAGIVQDLQLAKVASHDLLHNVVVVAEPPRVAHVVDANPHGKQGVVAPRRIAGLLADAAAELSDLVDQAQHGRRVGRDNGGVGGGAAVSKVVRQQRRLVKLRHKEANPVQAAAGSPAGQGRIAEGVAGRGLGAGHVEARLGVRVAERDQVLERAIVDGGGARGRAGGRRRLGGRGQRGARLGGRARSGASLGRAGRAGASLGRAGAGRAGLGRRRGAAGLGRGAAGRFGGGGRAREALVCGEV